MLATTVTSPARQIETRKPGAIPAALAGIGGDEGQRRIIAQKIEFPDREIGGADLGGGAAGGIDPIEPAPRLARVGDGRVLDLAPGKPHGPLGGAGIEAAVGGERDQRGAIAGPTQILDRAGNLPDRPGAVLLQKKDRSLAAQAAIGEEGETLVDG